MPRVVIAAGGTAGHVVPAVAVADELRARGAEVSFLGARGRLEAELVPEAGYEIDLFDLAGIDRKNPLRAAKAAAMAANAKSMLFGNYKKFIIRDVMDTTLFRMTDSAYTLRGQVGFVAFRRSGSNLIDAGAAVRYYQNSAS